MTQRILVLCGIIALLLSLGGFATHEMASSCIIGVTGSRASITVHGWGASQVCESGVQRSNGQLFLRREPPTEPVLCEIVKNHQRYVIRDDGFFVLIGRTLCSTIAKSDILSERPPVQDKIDSQTLTIPEPVGLVNDFAGIIPLDRRTMIEQLVKEVRAKSHDEIVVVTLKNTGQQDVSDVATEIAQRWNVGNLSHPSDPTQNAGVVILVIPKETSLDGFGHCWIATGHMVQGIITDTDASEICREATPFFLRQDYGEAIKLVTNRVAQYFGFTLDTTLHVINPFRPSM